MFLPEPLVVRTPGEPEQQQDQGHLLKPWGVQRNFETLAQRFPLGPDDLHFGGYVTALPSSPADGQIIHYLTSDDSGGIVWQLRYRADSGSAYKWEYIGGAPLVDEVTAGEALNNGTYSDLATAGPSVALPLAGDYDVRVECVHSSAVASYFSAMSYAIGGTAAVDADAAEVNHNSNTDSRWNVGRSRRKLGLTAVTLTAKYRNAGGSVTYSNRLITAVPIRVG